MIKGVYKEQGPLSKVLIFISALLTGFGLSTIIGLVCVQLFFGLDVFSNPELLTQFNNPAILSSLKFMQLLHSVGIFILPVLLFAYTTSGSVSAYLKMNKVPNIFWFGITVLMMFVSLPIVNFLVEMNGNMVLPDALEPIETWMKNKEESAMMITELFLQMDSPSAYMYNILIVGIIPALGEELLFRGLIQKQVIKRTGNYHIGIWVAAFLFSAIHLQFYGFFPRFILGAIFGYLFVWSGSLWVPILAHFINNAGAVTVQYIFGAEFTENTIDSFGTETRDLFFLGLSLILAFSILRTAWKNRSQFIP